MLNFIILASDKRKYLVLEKDEYNAKIKFSQRFPSLKIRNINQTNETIFNIIE